MIVVVLDYRTCVTLYQNLNYLTEFKSSWVRPDKECHVCIRMRAV